jgi:hypothetical protein
MGRWTVLAVGITLATAAAATQAQTGTPSRPPSLGEPIVVVGGFDGPESVLHDAVADVYLVSNIAPTFGFPNAVDNNGYISRIRPDGTIEALKWIEGGVNGVTLNGPKGLAIAGDVLYVSDIDVVRKFDRVTGAPLGDIPVPNVPFLSWLNDLAAGPDGTVYASDSGIGVMCPPPFPTCPSGTDALFRIDRDDILTVVAQGPDLEGPNGLLTFGSNVFFVGTWGTGVFMWNPSGKTRLVAEVAGTSLDGIVRLDNGSLLVSSWVPPAIHWVDPSRRRVTPIKTFTVVDPEDPFANEVPADIGYDRARSRLLIPFATYNKVGIYPVQ